jgi:hypothetical protein
MKVFELRDKNNQSTELFKIKDFTTIKDVIDKLNKHFNLINKSFYTESTKGCFNYVYVSSDGYCRFVESLTEFSEGFQSLEDFKVNSSVEIV